MVNTSMRTAASLRPALCWTGRVIYHLTERSRWERSLAEGEHTGSTRGIELADEGFIHCSTADQWRGVRQRFYADLDDLVLLHIDETVLTAPVVYERVGDAPSEFPHVYGPIELAAVVEVQALD
jgi:glutathione S-transferase